MKFCGAPAEGDAQLRLHLQFGSGLFGNNAVARARPLYAVLP